MKKPWLLIAGHSYYPTPGTGDWIDTFETFAQAEAEITKNKHALAVFAHGPRKGAIKPGQTPTFDYYIRDRKYDWYEIVNLECWQKD